MQCGGLVVQAPHARQHMHLHEARLVVFVSGALTERTFAGETVFGAGEFVFRPDHFAHAGEAGAQGAAYTHLDVPENAARKWVSKHGWCAGRGKIDLADLGDAAAALASAAPFAYSPPQRCELMDEAAQQLAEGAPVREVAEAHGLAPHTFSRRFKASFGASPTSYRRAARACRALGMVAEGRDSLAAVAQTCGFHDQSHLTHELRCYAGQTPGQIFRHYRN